MLSIPRCVFLSVLLALLAGCSKEEELAEQPQGRDRREVIAALEDFARLMRTESLYDDDPALHKKLNYAGWSIGMLIGYDFKSSAVGWDLWVSWQKRQDMEIPVKAIRSDDPVVIQFGIDLAFGCRDKNVLEEMVLNMAERDAAYRDIVRNSVKTQGRTAHTLEPQSELWAELAKVLLPLAEEMRAYLEKREA